MSIAGNGDPCPMTLDDLRGGRQSLARMVVGFTTTYAISAYLY
jgi:hypothetical protein